MDIIDLSSKQIEQLADHLESYDNHFIPPSRSGRVSIGISDESGYLIAGLDATMTAFHILYVSTVFVHEQYRRQGFGRRLMEEIEVRAKALGAHTIRLDTFGWQGPAFYAALGYQEVGHYHHLKDNYSEHFFVKYI